MPRIKFLPSGVEADYQAGESVFDVGQREGVEIETSCVGQGTCGLCRVRVVEGEEHLSPPGDVDEKHLGNVYFLTKVRLSCQAITDGQGDITVELAPKKKRSKKR